MRSCRELIQCLPSFPVIFRDKNHAEILKWNSLTLNTGFSSAKLHFSPTREQRKVQYFFILTFNCSARNYSANPMMSTWSAPFGAEILQIYINLTNYLNDLDRFVRFLAVRRLLKGIRRIVTLAHPLASPHACGRIAQFIRLHQPIQ